MNYFSTSSSSSSSSSSAAATTPDSPSSTSVRVSVCLTWGLEKGLSRRLSKSLLTLVIGALGPGILVVLILIFLTLLQLGLLPRLGLVSSAKPAQPEVKPDEGR